MALPNRSPPFLSNLGHGLAKVLGIKLNYRNPTGEEEKISRGESVFSASTADTYVEEEPTAWEWVNQIAPTGRTFLHWAYHLFPFTHWIGRYNVQWLYGDLVAGRNSLSLRLLHVDDFFRQVLLLAQSSSPSPWRMPVWPSLRLNLGFTPPSWAFLSIGFLLHQKTSRLA